jgi:hypothetical protein
MARSYGFFAQCFLFAFIMYFSQLRLARDDIRTSGVHVRTLVAAVQVGMLAVILSMQAVLRFIVGVVKRDNLAFALLGRSSSRRSTCSRSPRSPRSLRSERSAGFTAFDDDLEEFDPDVESTGRRQADLKDAGLELVVAPERVSADAEEGGARKQFLEDVGKHHNDVEQELMIEKHTSLAPSPPPSLLSGAHSGEDGLENAIVFESNTKLDLYCLYIHSVGAVMYQTFMSFDYTLFNTQWMFATGLLVGWTATSLSNVCLKSAQRQELASRVRGSMWVLFYASIALAIQVSALVVWSWPEETSTGVLVNLYMPSFLAGCFWTTFCSEMAFAGTRTSRGILFDSRRALPTFLLVTAVGALYSSPESRLSVVTYIESLSRLATLHLLLLEPVLKFVSIYVLVIILERKKATDLVLSICFVQGLFLIVLSPAFDVAAITALTGCVVLLAVYTTRLVGAF